MRKTLLVLSAILLVACASHAPKELDVDVARPGDVRQRADLAAQHGNCGVALDNYRQLLKLAPGDRGALIGIGECWLALGEAAPALSAFEEVLRKEPDAIDAQEGRALARLGLGRQAEAADGFRAVLAREPARWRSLDGLGLLADLAGDREGARQWYLKAVAANPDEATVWNNYGWSRVMAQDYAGAEHLLDEAYARKPTSQRIATNLAVAIAWQGDYPRALRIAMRNSPEHVAYNDIGYIAMMRGDNATAAEFFRKAIDKAPSWFERAAANLRRAQQAMQAEAARGAP